MTEKEMRRLGISPCAYRFANSERIRVEWRGDDRWAITRGGVCLANDGLWEVEPMPSNRDEAFIARCRYSLGEALRRGSEAVAKETA